MNMLPLRLGARWECLLLPVLFQYSTEKSNHCKKVIERKKHTEVKRKNKLVLFANYMIVYVGNSKEFTKISL